MLKGSESIGSRILKLRNKAIKIEEMVNTVKTNYSDEEINQKANKEDFSLLQDIYNGGISNTVISRLNNKKIDWEEVMVLEHLIDNTFLRIGYLKSKLESSSKRGANMAKIEIGFTGTNNIKASKTKTQKQVRYLLSDGSPLTEKQKDKLKKELHTGEVKIEGSNKYYTIREERIHPRANGAYATYPLYEGERKLGYFESYSSDLKIKLDALNRGEITLKDLGLTPVKTYASKRQADRPIGTEGLNGYIAYYKGKQLEVYAKTSYEAQEKAAEMFKAKKSYEVTVMLAEKASGEEVVHSGAELDGSKRKAGGGAGFVFENFKLNQGWIEVKYDLNWNKLDEDLDSIESFDMFDYMNGMSNIEGSLLPVISMDFDTTTLQELIQSDEGLSKNPSYIVVVAKLDDFRAVHGGGYTRTDPEVGDTWEISHPVECEVQLYSSDGEMVWNYRWEQIEFTLTFEIDEEFLDMYNDLFNDYTSGEEYHDINRVKYGISKTREASKYKAEDIEDEYEDIDEPSPDDIVMYNSGSLGSKTSVGSEDYGFMGEFNSEEEAEEFIRDWMKTKNFYPQVWYQDDHGGFVTRDLTKRQATVRRATGEKSEPDNITVAIADRLNTMGFDAEARAFDNYQGDYIRVRGIGKFWFKDYYTTGKRLNPPAPEDIVSATLIDKDGGTYSANRGDYFQFPSNYIFEGYKLVIVYGDGYREELDNPTQADLPSNIVGTTFRYEKGSETEHIVLAEEEDWDTDIEVWYTTDEKGNILELGDGNLIDYCETKKGNIRQSSRKDIKTLKEMGIIDKRARLPRRKADWNDPDEELWYELKKEFPDLSDEELEYIYGEEQLLKEEGEAYDEMVHIHPSTGETVTLPQERFRPTKHLRKKR